MQTPTINQIIKNNTKFEDQLMKPTGEEGKVVANFLTKVNYDKAVWSISFLDLKDNDIALEIGYGSGFALKLLSQEAINGKIYGLDFSETMHDEATKLFKDEISEGKIKLDVGDIAQSPYKDNFFDKIIAVNVLYFWTEPVQVLKEILKILKPGGKVVFFIYHKDSELHQERAKDGVFAHYSGEEVVELMNSAGFMYTRFEEKPFENGKMIGVSVIGEKA